MMGNPLLVHRATTKEELAEVVRSIQGAAQKARGLAKKADALEVLGGVPSLRFPAYLVWNIPGGGRVTLANDYIVLSAFAGRLAGEQEPPQDDAWDERTYRPSGSVFLSWSDSSPSYTPPRFPYLALARSPKTRKAIRDRLALDPDVEIEAITP